MPAAILKNRSTRPRPRSPYGRPNFVLKWLLFFFLPGLCYGQKPELVVPIGHTNDITCATFSPNGQFILTGSRDKTVRLWSLEGQELQAFHSEKRNHYAAFHTVFFSQNGQYVIARFRDLVEVWNLSGKKLFKADRDGQFHDLSYGCTGGEDCNDPEEVLMLEGGKLFWYTKVDTTDMGGYTQGPIFKEAVRLRSSKQDTLLFFDSPGISYLAFAPPCTEDFECHYEKEYPFLTVNYSNSATLYNIKGDTLHHFLLPGIDSAGFTADRKWLFFRTGTGKLIFKDWAWNTVFEKNIPPGTTFRYISSCPEGLICDPENAFVILEEDRQTEMAKIWDTKNKLLASFPIAGLKIIDFTENCQDCPGGTTHLLLTQTAEGFVQMRNFKGELKLDYWKQSWPKNSDIRFSPAGDRILSTLFDGDYRGLAIGDTQGRQLSKLKAHPAPRLTASFTSTKSIAIVNQSPLESHLDSMPSYWDSQTQEYRSQGRLPEGERFQTYSPDGRYLLSAQINDNWEYTQTFLRDREGQLLQSFSHAGRLSGFTSDGKKLFISNEWTIKLFELSGQEIWSLEDDHAGSSVICTAVSSGGKYVLSAYPEDMGSSFVLGMDSTGNREIPELNLYDFENKDAFRDFYEYTCATISQDEQFVLLGDEDGMIELYNLAKKSVHYFKGHTSTVRSTAIDPDNRFVLTSSDDGTVKLWDLNTTDLLATIIPIGPGEWVCKTPNGLFDASPGAMQLLYYFYPYQDSYEVIELDQLKARYYEPGLLQKILGYSDERIRPVENFKTVALYPKVEAIIVQDTLQIDLHARNGGIGKVSLFINGKEVVEEANPLPRRENANRDSIIRYDLKQHQNFLLRHPDSTNTISIRAYNEEGWLKSQAINLDYKLPAARSKGSDHAGTGSAWVGQLDPKLYVISIGTSDYTGTKLDLQYADQDATMMAKALQSVGTALFTNGDSLEVHCLSTAAADSTGLEGTPIHWQFADKNKIKTTFEAIKGQAKAEDVVIVYLSGHGLTQGGTDQTQFYYLTQGVASADDLVDPATLRAYTLSSEELTKWINDIPALKQVLIIDACNSGQIVENLTGGTKALNSSQIRALDRMKDRTGMFVLSGSASDKVSYEAGEYGQGLLTYALLEGMLSATRKATDGEKVVEMIDVMTLFQHARDRVPELASSINGIQTPMLGFPSRAASFDIGILDEQAKINIPTGNKKPVLTRSTFFNQVTFQDDLRLGELLEAALRKESEDGSNADLIYVDVFDYPGAYSISGLYEATADEIKITVKLFKDRKNPIELELIPTNDVDRLVRYIVREVKKVLAKRDH